MGAPIGNQNGKKGKAWADALRGALLRFEDKKAGIKRGDALHKIAEQVVKEALGGNPQAVKEIGDRLDGKPAQAIVGPDDGPLQFEEVRRSIQPAK